MTSCLTCCASVEVGQVINRERSWFVFLVEEGILKWINLHISCTFQSSDFHYHVMQIFSDKTFIWYVFWEVGKSLLELIPGKLMLIVVFRKIKQLYLIWTLQNIYVGALQPSHIFNRAANVLPYNLIPYHSQCYPHTMLGFTSQLKVLLHWPEKLSLYHGFKKDIPGIIHTG